MDEVVSKVTAAADDTGTNFPVIARRNDVAITVFEHRSVQRSKHW